MLSNFKMKMEVTEDGSDVTSPQHWNNEILKRERVESLVSMIKKEPPSLKLTPGEHFYTQPINGCKKRKFYHPQQQPQPQRRPVPEMEEETEEEEEEEAVPHHHHQQQQQSLSEDWRHKVTEMQLQLATMQRRLIQMYSKGQSTSPEIEKTTPSPATGIENLIENAASSYGISSEDWSCLAQSLKTGMSKLIDEWAKRYGQRSKPTNHHHLLLPQTTPTSVRVLQPVFPQSPVRYAPYPPRSGTPPPPSHDDDSPMSLVVSPRKRRWKVTDKVIRMQQSRYSEDQSDVPTNLSLSNPSHQSAMKQQSELNSLMLMMSPDSSPFKTDTEGEFGLASATLTPLHLRKAKLMFFYVRYPTSSVLKENFPDIKFNKNNTAQLVKWFSNFREFYYIQMEKYARQALSDGCASSSEVTVSTDSDIYRVLTQHYNRNTNIKVPVNFRYVIEQTLREFFDAISLGKNNDPSWKKVIYKVIARLDDPLPPFFKSTHFVDQLD